MRTNIVLTLTGADRIGIVHDVTESLLGLNANVEASRMARLGGEFAMLMLVSLPAEQITSLDAVTETLTTQGYKVTTTETQQTHAEALPGWSTYQIDIGGADHEGILHQIAQHLSRRGINIEALESGTERAPFGGTPLFTLIAHVAVPPSLSDREWVATLEDVGRRLNIDITVAAAEKR
jgi:glycine cleavage system transcriptional repressor